jgi:hypothetical protein
VWRWKRRGDGMPYAAVIVSMIGDERCLVILRTELADHFMMKPDTDHDATVTFVTVQGARVAVPRGAVLPCERGLQALQGVGGLNLLWATHTWRKVPLWQDDPLYEQLGDLVEDLMGQGVRTGAGRSGRRIRCGAFGSGPGGGVRLLGQPGLPPAVDRPLRATN